MDEENPIIMAFRRFFSYYFEELREKHKDIISRSLPVLLYWLFTSGSFIATSWLCLKIFNIYSVMWLLLGLICIFVVSCFRRRLPILTFIVLELTIFSWALWNIIAAIELTRFKWFTYASIGLIIFFVGLYDVLDSPRMKERFKKHKKDIIFFLLAILPVIMNTGISVICAARQGQGTSLFPTLNKILELVWIYFWGSFLIAFAFIRNGDKLKD